MTVEPAGQTRFLFSSVTEGTVNGSQVRSRLGTYFKGGRVYKVDQVVANATLPTPQLVSALATSQVCGDSGIASSPTYATGSNLANPQGSWMFLCGPGARYVNGQAIHANGGAYLGG